MQKEEFQHTAYATNAYVTVGPLAKHVLLGKKIIKLGTSSEQKGSSNIMKQFRRNKSSDLEIKLDDLRKEIASSDGGIFPHSVLSTQQINMLSAQKPKSMEQLEKIIGKLKTEKYGSKIFEEIKKYDEHEGDDVFEENQPDTSRVLKKRKTKEALVVIESSGDEV